MVTSPQFVTVLGSGAAAAAAATDAREYAIQFPGGNAGRQLIGSAGSPPVPTSAAVASFAGWFEADNVTGRKTLVAYHTGQQNGLLLELNGNVLRWIVDGGAIAIPSTTATFAAATRYFFGVTNKLAEVVFYFGTYSAVGGLSLTTETKTVGSDTPDYTGAVFQIGGNNQGSVADLAGLMSEVSYWDATLTSAQMDAIYDEGKGTRYSSVSKTNLIAYYGLQDASGGAVDEHTGGYDLSESGATGSLTYQQSFS